MSFDFSEVFTTRFDPFGFFRCMTDGRNHVPCCIQEKIPDICQDICKGEYAPMTDNIKTHVSCSAYMEQTLACIVGGIGKKIYE